MRVSQSISGAASKIYRRTTDRMVYIYENIYTMKHTKKKETATQEESTQKKYPHTRGNTGQTK